MRINGLYVVLAAFVAAALMPTGASAQQGRGGYRYGEFWDKLGCVEIGFRGEREVIPVGQQSGRFKAIRLEVERRDVFINDLKVVYANGEADDLVVGAFVRQGVSSRALDVRGHARSIERVEVIARKAEGQDRGRAEICVFGLEARREEIERFQMSDRHKRGYGPGRRENWVELGCERAGFINDRDTIRVARREDRFHAIRLNVTGNDVIISDINVFYGSGENQHFSVDQQVDRNETTRPMDLGGGRARRIDRVELTYHSKPSLRGEARVCLQALE